MAQDDFDIPNGPGQGVRQDVGLALLALATQSSGADEPSTTYPYMPWADTTNDVLKIRNGANNGWVDIYVLSTGQPVAINLGNVFVHQGNLDASFSLLPSDPEPGYYYRISVPGTLPDVGPLSIDDAIIYNGSGWDKQKNSDTVTAVVGLVGSISKTALQTALELGTAAYKNNSEVVKPGDAADLSSLAVGGVEVVDSSAKIDWSRLKNKPTFTSGTITGRSGRTTTTTGSGNGPTTFSYVEVEQTGSKLRARNYYVKSNCNCDCTG